MLNQEYLELEIRKYSSLFTECNESIKAYGVASHRHTPEIEQELSKACK